jgi:hypothetical protein
MSLLQITLDGYVRCNKALVNNENIIRTSMLFGYLELPPNLTRNYWPLFSYFVQSLTTSLFSNMKCKLSLCMT